jgi:hypothetical protein
MKRGVKGMLPLDCLPRWGREGVTLITSVKLKKNMGSNMVSPEPFFLKEWFLIYHRKNSCRESLMIIFLTKCSFSIQ